MSGGRARGPAKATDAAGMRPPAPLSLAALAGAESLYAEFLTEWLRAEGLLPQARRAFMAYAPAAASLVEATHPQRFPR